MAKKMVMGVGAKAKGGTLGDPATKLKEMEAANQYNFQFIDKEKIHPNSKNSKYLQEDIDSLMRSIIVNGLRHNLSVIYDTETPGYRIISGERRYHAICQLSEKDYNTLFPAGIPCKIEKSNIDEIDEEIMLISANHDVRETSMEVKRWEVSRLKELYTAKKNTGEIKSVAEEIAKQLSISKRQAIKYMNTDKLIPELSEILNNKGISLEEANNYSSLTEDAQKTIVEMLKSNGSVEPEDYKFIKEQAAEQTKLMSELKEELEYRNRTLLAKDKIIKSLEEQVELLQKDEPKVETKAELEERLALMKNSLSRVSMEREKLKEEIIQLKEQQKHTAEYKIDEDALKKVKAYSTINGLLGSANASIKELSIYKKEFIHYPEVKVVLTEIYSRIENLLEYMTDIDK